MTTSTGMRCHRCRNRAVLPRQPGSQESGFRADAGISCVHVITARRLIDVNLRSPWWQRQQVLDLIDAAWLAKLNDEELLQLVPDAQDDATRMQQLIGNAGLQLLLITRGAAGAELLTAGGDSYRVAPDSVTSVVDTVGAGDALTSVLILGVLQGWPYRQTLERAQAFASAIVGCRGAIVEGAGFLPVVYRCMGAVMTLEQEFLESLQRYFREERNNAHLVLHQLHDLGKPLLLRGEVQDAFARGLCESPAVATVLPEHR